MPRPEPGPPSRRPTLDVAGRAGSTPTCRCRRTPTPATPAPTCSPPSTSRSPGGAGPGADRHRDRAAGRLRRAGAPALGLAARHGLSIVNTPGTVDAGYRGEIKVLLVNHDPVEPVELRRGDRIAQLVVQRFERARFVEVEELPESVRGAGGYGSTGGSRP